MTTANLASCAPSYAVSAVGNPDGDIITLRDAEHEDLALINNLIAAAIGTWRLTDRIKRISLPLYQYSAQDLKHLQVIVADEGETTMVGIATIEAADPSECPWDHNTALLHGIFVDPLRHRNGIGTRLLEHIQTIASSSGFDGLLIRANPEATSFFEARAFEKLTVEDPSRDYPLRYWKPL